MPVSSHTRLSLVDSPRTVISPVEEIVEEIKKGRMVIVVDEEDRENEGDLLIAAEYASAQMINFMARFGRGLICLTLTEERCKQLNLPLMVAHNKSQHGTNFTISIEAAKGVSTGISAADRAHTIQLVVNPKTLPSDIVQPGHVFPIMAQPGGVLVRAGHTEAGCDFARMAGLFPAGVICEIMNDDGAMARLPDLVRFAEEHHLKIGTIEDLIRHRSQHERLIKRLGERYLSTPWGKFKVIVYGEQLGQSTHLALVQGDILPESDTLVRVHEPLSTLDWLDTDSSIHSWSLQAAMKAISNQGAGVLVLMNINESHSDFMTVFSGAMAYRESDSRGGATDLRRYGIGAQILRDLGVKRMRLLAYPRKTPSMTGFDLEIIDYLPPSS